MSATYEHSYHHDGYGNGKEKDPCVELNDVDVVAVRLLKREASKQGRHQPKRQKLLDFRRHCSLNYDAEIRSFRGLPCITGRPAPSWPESEQIRSNLHKIPVERSAICSWQRGPGSCRVPAHRTIAQTARLANLASNMLKLNTDTHSVNV